MFTSRAEYRLQLRADNADQRLTGRGVIFGCVGSDRARRYEAKAAALIAARAALEARKLSPDEVVALGLQAGRDGRKRSALEWLGLCAAPDPRLAVAAGLGAMADETLVQAHRDAIYARFMDRQEDSVRALDAALDNNVELPSDFLDVPGLSKELTAKLTRLRPRTIGEAARIEGMTPAGLMRLLAVAERQERRR
jgi:tRNA uridine 5-carboxymethylaminomethyl modification enzyme